MAKIVSFMLVIMSLSLYSQQDTYWKKLDFDFGSGVKLIHINQKNDDYNPFLPVHPFIVATDSNRLFFFNYKETKAVEVNLPKSNMEIRKIRMIDLKPNPIILILADMQLLITRDLGVSWENINSMNNLSNFIDFEIPKGYISHIYAITSMNELLKSTDQGSFWTKDTVEFVNEKPTLLSSEESSFFCLTDSNNIYINETGYLQNKWELQKSLKKPYHQIKDLRCNNYYVYSYLDSNFKNLFIDYLDSLYLINNSQNDLKISCFTTVNWFFLTFDNVAKDLPFNDGILFGTLKKGIYYIDPHYLNNNKNFDRIGNELDGLTITDIQTNYIFNPVMCLVGTKEDGLYYGTWPFLDVKENPSNHLQTQIYPQPASDKAKLNFTLPQSSQVSIKLYNTLGIELQTIANTFFSEGLNSIPIDLSNFSDAVYFVVIDYQGERVVEKIVVRK